MVSKPVVSRTDSRNWRLTRTKTSTGRAFFGSTTRALAHASSIRDMTWLVDLGEACSCVHRTGWVGSDLTIESKIREVRGGVSVSLSLGFFFLFFVGISSARPMCSLTQTTGGVAFHPSRSMHCNACHASDGSHLPLHHNRPQSVQKQHTQAEAPKSYGRCGGGPLNNLGACWLTYGGARGGPQ